MADYQLRNKSALGSREIKASANYQYGVNGITLGGSKFTNAELVLEGQCLVMDNTTKLYEKNAAANPAPAVLLGSAVIVPATLAALNAGTSLAIVVDGDLFVMSNAALVALAPTPNQADFLAAVRLAINSGGTTLNEIASVTAVTNRLNIELDEIDAGQTIQFVITPGVAGNTATLQTAFGVLQNAQGIVGGTGFPVGKSNAVVLDQSIRFELTDGGANPNVTVGQYLVGGSVYQGMLINYTEAFGEQMKNVHVVSNV